MKVRRGIDRKKVGCRSLIDAYLEGQVGVNKFKLHIYKHVYILCRFINAWNQHSAWGTDLAIYYALLENVYNGCITV